MTEKKTAVILEGIAHLYTIYILPLTLLILNQLDSCYHCFYTFPCKDKIGWSFCISRGCPSQGLTHAEVPFSFPSSQILPATPPPKSLESAQNHQRTQTTTTTLLPKITGNVGQLHPPWPQQPNRNNDQWSPLGETRKHDVSAEDKWKRDEFSTKLLTEYGSETC